MAYDSSAFAQWRPLDSRLAQLEGRLTHHRRWLEKETEGQVQDFEIVEQHRQKYLRSCTVKLTQTLMGTETSTSIE
jgi:hypothetical protein